VDTECLNLLKFNLVIQLSQCNCTKTRPLPLFLKNHYFSLYKAMVRKRSKCTSTPSCIFMAWHWTKQRDRRMF